MLDEHGSPGFSLRALAEAEGYAVTAIYRCYPNRAALLKAMQLALFAELPMALDLGRMSALPLDAGLYELAVAFVRWGVEHPARYRFMFLSAEPEALLEGPEQALARAPLHALTAVLALAHDRGELAPGLDPEATATWLFAGLHGLIALRLQERLDPEVAPDLPQFVQTHARQWLALMLRRSDVDR